MQKRQFNLSNLVTWVAAVNQRALFHLKVATPLYSRSCFFKMGHSRSLFLYCRLFNTVDSKQMLDKRWPMPGFEKRISGVEGDRSTTEPQPLPISRVLHSPRINLSPFSRSCLCQRLLASFSIHFCLFHKHFPNIFYTNLTNRSMLMFKSSIVLKF